MQNAPESAPIEISKLGSFRELAAVVTDRLPSALVRTFEWCGLHIGMSSGDAVFGAEYSIPDDSFPIIHWYPGSNEGFMVEASVHTSGQLVCVWHAKMFDAKAAAATHLLLLRMFFDRGRIFDDFLNNTARVALAP